MKTPLQILILILISIPQLIWGQENKSSTKITLNSIQISNDSTKESSEVINVNNIDHAMYILDSILNKNGVDFNSIKNILGDLEIDTHSLNGLGNMLEVLSKDFNHIFEMSPTTKKVVLGIVIDDYSNVNNQSEVHPVVTEVIQNSAAHEAGLQENDILLQIDKKAVHSIQDIFNIMKDKTEGDILAIQYIRDLDTIETSAKLQASKAHNENWFSLFQDEMTSMDSCIQKRGRPFCEKILIQKSGPRLGVKVRDLDAEARNDLKAKKGGALITHIQPKSAAEQMQLHVNDVIISINGQEIQNIAELKEFVNNLPIPQEIQVKYIRYGKKKKVKGMINEFSKPWDDNELMNIIDLSKFPTE